MNLVKVVIPIYQASLSQQERKSLLQVYKILQMHPLVVIKPNHLDLSELATEFPKLSFNSQILISKGSVVITGSCWLKNFMNVF